MVMIEITEDKFEDLYENIENMLRYSGKAMTCLDHLKKERMGERMPDYRDGWKEERERWRNDREGINGDWNYPSRYGERGGGYHGGGNR